MCTEEEERTFLYTILTRDWEQQYQKSCLKKKEVVQKGQAECRPQQEVPREAVQPHGQGEEPPDVRGVQEAGANKIQTLLPGANKILLPGGRSEQTLLPRANKIQILMPEDVIGEDVLLVRDGG